MIRFVHRRPLVTFFVLSCLFAWWPLALYVRGWSPTAQAGFGPFIAAVVVLAVTQGREGVRRLLASMVRWRVPKRAYVAAIATPLLVSGAAIVLNLVLGATQPVAADLSLWTQIPVTLLLVLLVPGLGGAWEEPGFRGYALGRLEQRYGAAGGPLVLGLLWVVWHLPLFLTGDILWPDVIVVIAASVVVAAVFHLGRDSVLIAMLFHATNNAVGGSYASLLFHGADKTRLNLITAAGWTALAIALVIRTLRRSRKSGAGSPDFRQPATPPAPTISTASLTSALRADRSSPAFAGFRGSSPSGV
jgi:membrane protease YdiL (CAAX protease family)